MKTLFVILTLLCGAVPVRAQFIFGPKSGGAAAGATVTDTVRAVTFDSVRATRLIPIDSIRFNGTTTAIRGGAGNMIIQAGTGNSRTLTLQTTTSAGTAKNTLVLGADSSAVFLGELQGTSSLLIGSTAIPDVNLSRDLGSSSNRWAVVFGFRFQADSGTNANPSVTSTIDGNTGLKWAGSDSLTIVTGGARRRLISAVYDSSSLRTIITGDTLRATQRVRFPGLTAAAATQNSACVEVTTKEILENAASSCLVSSIRYKKNVQPLSQTLARRIVSGVRPVTFQFRSNNLSAIGVIAEQADSIDGRLTTLDSQGRVHAVNYEQITVALLAVVKEQQKLIESLTKRVAVLEKKP